MVRLAKDDQESLRRILLEAVVNCTERCLYQSAKWAAELATSLATASSSNPSFDSDTDETMQDDDTSLNLPPSFSRNPDAEEARLEAKEYPQYLLAKSFFDCREYDRCANVFLPSQAGPMYLSDIAASSSLRTPTKSGQLKAQDRASITPKAPVPVTKELPLLSQKSLFLALYAKYMSGEKKKDEESEYILGPADGGSVVNKELVTLTRLLEGWFSNRVARGLEDRNQGWLEYLYGIVLAKGKMDEDAKRWLIQSVRLCPFNWGAWLELNGLLNNHEDLQAIVPRLPQNLMTLVFHLYASQELYQYGDAVHDQVSQLEDYFPQSLFLKTQRALLYYHSKDFEEAETIFSAILLHDPFRIDSLDHYSNILYVKVSRAKLAFLAQVASATDKFRPETCCVVGNYYSLKSEHEKAVVYFRRALTLDRNFLSAWTLMGHEYIEMKNTHAAIESYRRAVDINRKDYRAWYGLGLSYEILEMHLYALFYFQRAASLRPHDPKMWQVMGVCYDKIDRPHQAIKAYKRALVAGGLYERPDGASVGASFGSSQATATALGDGDGRHTMDPEMLYAIAQLYEKVNDTDEAAAYMEMTLMQEDGVYPSGALRSRKTALRNAGGELDLSDSDATPGADTEGVEVADDEDDAEPLRDDDLQAGSGGGTGPTATTSKARMWLARWAFSHGDLRRAMRLASELCDAGTEVEEAKALIRDLRARSEAA